MNLLDLEEAEDMGMVDLEEENWAVDSCIFRSLDDLQRCTCTRCHNLDRSGIYYHMILLEGVQEEGSRDNIFRDNSGVKDTSIGILDHTRRHIAMN